MNKKSFLLALGLVVSDLTAFAEELESFINVQKPPALEFVSAEGKPKALERFFGDPLSRNHTENISNCVTDGARVYAATQNANAGSRSLTVWKLKDGDMRPVLEGFLPASSPRPTRDGKCIFVRRESEIGNLVSYGCYRTGTWEGLWNLDEKKIYGLEGAAFSPDSKTLAIVNFFQGVGNHLILLDTESGRTRKVVRLGVRQGAGNGGDGSIVYGKGSILLPPHFDTQGRITRISLEDWKLDFLRVPQSKTENQWSAASRMQQSPDERWLVLRDYESYAVLKSVGDGYEMHFEGGVDQHGNAPGISTPLETVAISPDSLQLVVSGCVQHKVIDIASKGLIHESVDECRCGFYSGNGKVFWRTCSPFTPVDTLTWETAKNWTRPAHLYRIQGLAFSADGKWLASCDQSKMHIWSVDGDSPVADCRSPNKETSFQSPIWSKDGKKLYCADGWEFLSWQWSGTADPSGSLEIAGVNFLGRPTGNRTKPLAMKMVRDPFEKQFLVMDGYREGVTIRYPEKPGVVGRFKLDLPEESMPIRPPGIANKHHLNIVRLAFTGDGKEVIFRWNGLHAYNLNDDTIRSVKSNDEGDVIANDSISRSTVSMSSREIKVVSDQTLEPLWSLSAPADILFEYPFSRITDFFADGQPVLSPDGKWLAFCGERRSKIVRSAILVIINMKERKIAALQDMPIFEYTAAAFTPDSKKLALGHLNGVVSLWNISELTSSPPVLLPESSPQKQQGPMTPTTLPGNLSRSGAPRRPLRWESETLPDKPLVLTTQDKSTTWNISEGGVAGVTGVLTSAGGLSVDSKPIRVISVRSRKQEVGIGILEANLECEAGDGALLVSREMMLNGMGRGTWTDILQNVSEASLDVVVDFEWSPDCGIEKFQDESAVPVKLQGREVIASRFANSIWSPVEGAVDSGLVAIGFSRGRTASTARLFWDSNSKKIRSRYDIHLAPFERKMLIHTVAARVSAKGKLGISDVKDLLVQTYFPFQTVAHPASMELALNFEKMTRPVVPASLKRAPGYVATRGPERPDAFGFNWFPPERTFGFANEMGIESGLEVWLDGAPATFKQTSDSASNPQNNRISIFELSNRKGSISLSVDSMLNAPQSTWNQRLIVENKTDSLCDCALELVTVASSPIAALLDGDGERLDFGASISPSGYHGTVTIETTGNTRPATVLALGREGGVIPLPDLRVKDGRVLIARYNLKMKPREAVSLYHAATQRPLKAYPSFADAIASWDAWSSCEAISNKQKFVPQNWPRR